MDSSDACPEIAESSLIGDGSTLRNAFCPEFSTSKSDRIRNPLARFKVVVNDAPSGRAAFEIPSSFGELMCLLGRKASYCPRRENSGS